MSKIALVGIWNHYNYGSALTNFASYHVFKDRTSSVLMVSQPLSSIQKPDISHIYKEIPYEKAEIAPFYADKVEMRQLNEMADIFCVTSDQLLSGHSYYSFDGFMLLDYIDNNIPKASYAASFGYDRFLGFDFGDPDNKSTLPSSELKYHFKKSLNKFSLFSVREKSGVALAKEYFDVNAEFVLDPVFLCKKEYYHELAQRGTPLGSHGIFAYILNEYDERENIIREISKEKNFSYAIVHDYGDGIETNFEGLPKIEDFIASYIASDFIVTDSFHGVCLSIIFRKQFICINNSNRGAERFESILGITGLKHRMVQGYSDFIEKKDEILSEFIDFDLVEDRLSGLKKESLDFIEKIVNLHPNDAVQIEQLGNDTVMSELVTAEEYIDDLENQRVEAQSYIDDLHKQRGEAQNYIDDLHQQRKEAQDYIDNLHKQREETQIYIDELHQQIIEKDKAYELLNSDYLSIRKSSIRYSVRMIINWFKKIFRGENEQG